MFVLTECPRSVVPDHLCGHSQSVSMHRPAQLMGLRAEGIAQ